MPPKPRSRGPRYDDLLTESEQQGRRIARIKRYIQRDGRGHDPAPEVEAVDDLFEDES